MTREKDINVPIKIRQLGVFDIRAFLDLASETYIKQRL